MDMCLVTYGVKDTFYARIGKPQHFGANNCTVTSSIMFYTHNPVDGVPDP